MINLLLWLFLPLFGTVYSESYPEVLSPEDEKMHLDLWRAGDENSRNALIEHNLRLVAHIVKKYNNTREEKDDLLSIGAFGLIKAVDTYNFDAQTKLATYASRCIENEILMYLRSSKRKRQTTWLYSPIGQDKEGNEICLSDIIEDPQMSVSDRILYEENKNRILDALDILNERELEIISRRFGLNNQRVETQREIASSLDISRSYVSRIEKRALTKIYLKLKK